MRKVVAESRGFNLHAATRFAAHERPVERFCRYATRGPLTLGRLSLAANGHVVYRLKTPRPDGTSHVVFTPHSFLVLLKGVFLVDVLACVCGGRRKIIAASPSGPCG